MKVTDKILLYTVLLQLQMSTHRSAFAHLEPHRGKQIVMLNGTVSFTERIALSNFKSLQNNSAPMTTEIAGPSGRTGGTLKCL